MTTLGDTTLTIRDHGQDVRTIDVKSLSIRSGVIVDLWDRTGNEQIARLDLNSAEAIELAQALITAASASTQWHAGQQQQQIDALSDDLNAAEDVAL